MVFNVYAYLAPTLMANQHKRAIKSNNCALNCTITETEILEFLRDHPTATQKEVATAVSKSLNTAKNATVHLQELGLLKREGAKKNGRWIVILD